MTTNNGRVMTFIRHAMPDVDPAVPSSEWALSLRGVAASKELALPRHVPMVSSPELKAAQTLAFAAGTTTDSIRVDSAFREIDRIEAVGPTFRAARRAWIGGVPEGRLAGWECTERSAARFDAGLSRDGQARLVVATHGMVLTAWMVERGLIERGQSAVAFWEQLTFPAVLTVELSSTGTARLLGGYADRFH